MGTYDQWKARNLEDEDVDPYAEDRALEDERHERFATPAEAVAEFGYNAGMDHPDQPWLLHDWDVWVKNPHYRGPPVRHPEDPDDAEPVAHQPEEIDDTVPF